MFMFLQDQKDNFIIIQLKKYGVFEKEKTFKNYILLDRANTMY